MKRNLTIAAATITTAAVLVGTAASSHAAPGVTHHHYLNVEVGESKAKVERVFGTHGVRFGEGARNQYGKRLFKVYKADATHFASVSYFRVKGSGKFRVIDSTWCTHPAGKLGCS